MTILIAVGAFKHSLTASAAATAIARGLRRSGLNAALHLMPIADGGNGTLDAFLVQGGQRFEHLVSDPLQRPIKADFGLIDDGETAIIEMALASGLELLRDEERDPLRATTFGTGELMQAALEAGARRFIIGMGGSATVDGGMGCLRALGVRFMDAYDNDVPHGGGSLTQIARIDVSGLDTRWKLCDVIIASDVDNPVIGEQGAAAVFGPQKGASVQDVGILENNLRHFWRLVDEQLGVNVRETRGGGAAGGFAGGLMAFLNGHIESGIDLILHHLHFVEHLRDASLVITGEGQMDEQTVHGKGPIGVAQLARSYGVPTVALVGGLNADDELLHEAGIQVVLPIVNRPMQLAEALRDADVLLERAALRLGYLLAVRGDI